MDLIHQFIDTFLHLDQKLEEWILLYGNLIYVILFLIIFTETGIVIWPWLPGDSLLFIAGAVAAVGSMNIVILLIVCITAAAFKKNT